MEDCESTFSLASGNKLAPDVVIGVHTGYTKARNKEDWEIRTALSDEIRRHRRLDSLPKDVIPEMQRRLRDICEAHGWPVPEEAGHGQS